MNGSDRLRRRAQRSAEARQAGSTEVHFYADIDVEELARLAADLGDALRAIRALQPEALEYIRRNGFVFDDIGSEPGNWKHLAFSLYTDLCQAESLCGGALARLDEWGNP